MRASLAANGPGSAIRSKVASVILALLSIACAGGSAADGPPAFLGYRVVSEYAHDANAFTQGLVYYRGFLYESTGRYGASSIRKVALETGEVVAERALADRYFGEGLTVVGDRLVQLTWRERTGFVYDAASLELIGSFHYPTEGWGLAYDGAWLHMSDGSATLYRLDPDTFGIIGKLEVRDTDGPVERLNELEFIEGFVYANVWEEDRIAKIDPASGRVVAWIRLDGLRERGAPGAGVLNGIAYDPASRRLLVTGKLWPKLFAIDIVAH
ncbi:MAG TPA: glutaminyl-peptide cyclotransferase [Gammaproteobacteria bacterium]|nr:glutaminyl-peptide cyclotransferase [Gammaproteobacteria bacterium]